MKRDCYIYEMFQSQHQGNHKTKVYSRYTQDRVESKCTTIGNHQITKGDSKRGRKEQKNCKIDRKQLTTLQQ